MRISTAESGVPDSIILAHTQTLSHYRSVLERAYTDTTYKSPASALAAPFDENAITQALTLAKEYGSSIRTVILVGIGGSDLGTRAVYDALWGYADRRTASHTPRLVCFDTVEPSALEPFRSHIAQHATPEELVLVVISKSGGTVETVSNANVLFDALVEKFGATEAARRTIYIGDSNDRMAAMRPYGIRCISMPTEIGGRYSVFTSVGLVPLALLGVDIRSLCEGAGRAVHAALQAPGPGPAATMAALLFESYTTGHTIHELVMFHPELETMGKWYRQLLAESLGKERGDGTRVGMTPSIFIGSTDLHSVGQLVFGGPKNRITTFTAAPSSWTSPRTHSSASPFILPMLERKSSSDVIRAVYEGVRTAYHTHALPYASIELDAISPREIGAWMALHMATVMYAAELFGVNAFDQPAVESYKSETRRILTGQHS